MRLNKLKISILTFVSISVIIVGIGFGGVHYSVNRIMKAYVDLQLHLNKRTAQTVSDLLAQQLDNNTSQEEVLSMFQDAISGNDVYEGYLCMFDQNTAKLLCHPNLDMVGVEVNSPSMRFDNLQLNKSQLLGDAVQTGNAEGGILTLEGEARSEITYMVPVKGTSWKVSVHENIEKTEQKMQQFATKAYIGFALLSLLISILATVVARRVSATYEQKIEQKNSALAQQNKQIQEQKATIEDYATKLEEKVRARTAELEKANAKLTHLEKAKSDFLGIISHELRTPLNGIIGFTDMLEEELKDTEHIESVQNIKTSGYRLMKFSETALLITELTSGNASMDFKNTDIREILSQARQKLDADFKKKAITLHTNQPDEKVMLPMVPELMEECLSNILKNALRYSPKDGHIYVNCYREGENFVCDFRDTGPGFSQEALGKLFDYFAADKVMNHTEGFGLGLSAANLIMEAHSGKIEVLNCDDKNLGARVRLIFYNVTE